MNNLRALGLSVVTMCVDLASTHLKAYFTRIHYFGRAKRFLGMSEELKEIVALLGAMRKKKEGKVRNDLSSRVEIRCSWRFRYKHGGFR